MQWTGQTTGQARRELPETPSPNERRVKQRNETEEPIKVEIENYANKDQDSQLLDLYM